MKTKTRKAGAKTALVAAVLAAFLAPAVWPQRSAPRQPAYALIAGTVFRADGLSLPGARVVLEPSGKPAGARRVRKQEAISDARGEFAFRVPPVEARYRLSASAAGYQPQHREVEIRGEERVDVFFRLEKKPGN